MEKINILYVDDKPDSFLERYLVEYCEKETEYELEYEEFVFDPQSGYTDLLQQDKIKSANIVFIDSMLFENASVGTNKFTGEEISVVIKKHYPYIEIFLITQNDMDDCFEHIRKFRSSKKADDATSYYNNEIAKKIKKAIANIINYRSCIRKLNDNPSWEQVIKEKINNTLNGVDLYNEMTKNDIDEVVRILKEIQTNYGV